MNRIYLRHIDLLLRSDNRSRAFLAYMKIRIASKNRCGGFNLKDLTEALVMSDTSSRKSLKRLLEYGYATEVKKGLYKINSFKNIVGENLHERFYKISDQEIFSYSWKNISHFRALLTELKIQLNRNKRKSLRKGYAVSDRHGVKERIKSQSKKEFDTLMASTYSAKITGKSYSTILRYRKRQKLVTYSTKEVKVIKSSKEVGNLDFTKGKTFTFGSLLIFFPISSRFGNVLTNGY